MHQIASFVLIMISCHFGAIWCFVVLHLPKRGPGSWHDVLDGLNLWHFVERTKVWVCKSNFPLAYQNSRWTSLYSIENPFNFNSFSFNRQMAPLFWTLLRLKFYRISKRRNLPKNTFKFYTLETLNHLLKQKLEIEFANVSA